MPCGYCPMWPAHAPHIDLIYFYVFILVPHLFNEYGCTATYVALKSKIKSCLLFYSNSSVVAKIEVDIIRLPHKILSSL